MLVALLARFCSISREMAAEVKRDGEISVQRFNGSNNSGRLCGPQQSG